MRRACFLLVFAAMLLASAVSAADPLRLEIIALEEQTGRLSVTVGAFDATGKPVADLTANSFRASLDGTDLPLQSLATPGTGGGASTAIVLLVDVSGTMYGDPIIQARSALLEFVKNLDPADQIAVIAFSTSITQLQDFTSNRTLINAAISKLTVLGDTALYDAVTAATRKAAEFQAAEKLVVLLSDGGVDNLSTSSRAASIEAARAASVSVVSVGFGSRIDREYMNDLANATGGRVVEASSGAGLRQAYIDLATGLRSRYTLHLTVPGSVDRTVPGSLIIRVSARGETAVAEWTLDPLPGAKAPSFNLAVDGLTANQNVKSIQTLTPRPAEGITLSQVEYLVDGQSVFVSTAAPFTYDLDGSVLQSGTHLVKVVATDARGSAGSLEVVFRVPAPTSSSPLAKMLPVLAVLLLLAAVAGGLFIFVRKRLEASDRLPDNVTRIKPFTIKVTEEMAPPEEWPERRVPTPQPANQILGRIVVMDEGAIRDGDLSTIREFSIGTAPLTLGAGSASDIQVEDGDTIAMEEARLWVQKGRLVYHKLTTLSAMATEGVTSGWLLLASGEDVRLGKYRLLYQAEVPASGDEQEPEEEPSLPPQNSQFKGWPA